MAKHAAKTHTQPASASKSRYIPALDGLRAFAVLAVIFYHMKLGWAPGGLMGVTVFFVISGYLINGLLVAERERSGTIDLPNFWLRRIRRLFPAIFLSVVGTAALCTVFDHVLLDKMRPDIMPSLLFFNNWWQIFRDISYFEAAGSPSPLTHFWSLSIEEQFYVVWPLVLLALYRFGVRKKTMARIVLVLAVLSALEMALLYNPMGDPSRIYYGTDTRAMSLLLGVWLAFVWPSAAFGNQSAVSSRHTAVWAGFNIAGIASFAGLLAIVVFTNGFSSFPYHGGIFLTTVLSAVLIAVLAVPDTWLSRVFALQPLVWIGKRSYGMYLWHFPIILLTTNANSTTGTPWWMHAIQIALVFIISDLSYRFIEDPIRKGKIGEWWRTREKRTGRRARLGARAFVPAGCFAALLIVACIGVFAVKPTDYASTYAQESSTSAQSPQSTGEDGSLPVSEGTFVPVEAYVAIFETPHTNAAGELRYEPLLIGDSVAAGAIDQFNDVFPYGHIDAEVNRNIWESPYGDYLEEDRVGDYVVFCLGTNNAVVDWQIDDDLLYHVAEDKHVFMVNTRNTDDWCESTNAEIAAAGERYPNVTVIDWYGYSASHDEWFAGDGTHLTAEGAEAYIGLIRDSIAATLEG